MKVFASTPEGIASFIEWFNAPHFDWADGVIAQKGGHLHHIRIINAKHRDKVPPQAVLVNGKWAQSATKEMKALVSSIRHYEERTCVSTVESSMRARSGYSRF